MFLIKHIMVNVLGNPLCIRPNVQSGFLYHYHWLFYAEYLMSTSRIYAALRAFAAHLLVSCVLAALAAWLVLQVWFPFPYRELAGGLHLFWVMVGVDVVCGPLLTAVLFNPRKSRRELTLDLSLVALVQLCALGYGLYSIALARPVIQAFEGDRFVVLSAIEIDRASLEKAPPNMQNLSWNGPVLVGTRSPKDASEQLQIVMESLQGFPAGAHPGGWQPYEKSTADVQQHMKPLANLRKIRPAEAQQAIDQAVQASGQPLDALFYVPLVSKKKLDSWIVLLDANAKIVGYAPVGGFD